MIYIVSWDLKIRAENFIQAVNALINVNIYYKYTMFSDNKC